MTFDKYVRGLIRATYLVQAVQVALMPVNFLGAHISFATGSSIGVALNVVVLGITANTFVEYFVLRRKYRAALAEFE